MSQSFSCGSSWEDVRRGGIAELVDGEPNLGIGVQAPEMNCAVIAERIEIVEQRCVAVAIAELQVVADVGGLGEIVAVIAFCLSAARYRARAMPGRRRRRPGCVRQ